MRAVFIIFLLITYSVACMGAGAYILRFFPYKKSNKSAATLLATSFLLGQGVLAIIWLGLAIAGVFTLPIIIAILVISLLGFILFLRDQIPSLGRQIASIWQELLKDNWMWKALAGLTLLLILAWFSSIGRSVIGDGSAFYFILPKMIAYSHELSSYPLYSGFMYVGLQGEMHYAALMALGSADAAQLFSWPTILAGVTLLLALGREAELRRRGQWLTLLMVFTSSCVILLSGDGKTDLFAAALGLACYYWAMQTWKEDKKTASWLTGLFAGFAITAKFSYIPVLLPGIALLVCWGFFDKIRNIETRKNAIKTLLTTSVIIIASFLIAMLPQLIKNTLIFQNPIAPFGMATSVSQVWFSPETTKRILLTYPLALTFGSYWAQYGTLTPLLLAFLPIALILPRPRQLSKSLLFALMITALLGLVIWMVSQPSVIAPRYFMSTLLLFFLLPAKAVETLSYKKDRSKILTFVVFFSIFGTLLTTGLYFNGLVFYPKTTIPYLSENSTVCSRDGEYCKAIDAINNEAKLGERVYSTTYYQYWLRPDLVQCDYSTLDQVNGSAPESFWDNVYRDGFHYLLIESTSIAASYLNNLPSWMILSPLFEGESVNSYRIDVTNPPVEQILICNQKEPNIWEVEKVK